MARESEEWWTSRCIGLAFSRGSAGRERSGTDVVV